MIKAARLRALEDGTVLQGFRHFGVGFEVGVPEFSPRPARIGQVRRKPRTLQALDTRKVYYCEGGSEPPSLLGLGRGLAPYFSDFYDSALCPSHISNRGHIFGGDPQKADGPPPLVMDGRTDTGLKVETTPTYKDHEIDARVPFFSHFLTHSKSSGLGVLPPQNTTKE